MKEAEAKLIKQESLIKQLKELGIEIQPNKKCLECSRIDASEITGIMCNGKALYYVAHSPIDMTMGINGDWSMPGLDDLWGLERVFENITDTDYGREMKRLFSFDKPEFVGRCIVPVTTDYEVRATYLYVVRCINNGTTYFVSEGQRALRTFIL